MVANLENFLSGCNFEDMYTLISSTSADKFSVWGDSTAEQRIGRRYYGASLRSCLNIPDLYFPKLCWRATDRNYCFSVRRKRKRATIFDPSDLWTKISL